MSETYQILLVSVLAFALLWLMPRLFARLRRRVEPGTEVRRLTRRGRFAEAAELQLERGLVAEALELFQRAGVHAQASHCAERLGRTDLAADLAERARDFERALVLFRRASDPVGAARAQVHLHGWSEAAEQGARDPGATDAERARLWSFAFVETIPSEGESITGSELHALRRAAANAGDAYERAGDLPNAVHYYELAGETPRADSLRAIVPPQAMAQLDFTRDRLLARLRGVVERSGWLSGPHVPVRPPAPSYDLAPPPGPPLPESAPQAAFDDSQGRAPEPTPQMGVVRGFATSAGQASSHPLPAPPSDSRPLIPSGPLTSVPPEPPGPSQSWTHPSDYRPAASTSSPGPLPRPEDRPSVPAIPLRERGTSPRLTVIDAAPPPDATETMDVFDAVSHASTPIRRHTTRYRLIDVLAQGRTTTMIRAHDLVLGRAVALKFLPAGLSASPVAGQIFDETARALTRLRHPNIPLVHEVGVMDGRPFVNVELVAGGSLAESLGAHEASRLPILEVLEIAEGLLSAIDYAHGHGVLHLELRPSHVLRTIEDGKPMVLDFGLSELLEAVSTRGRSDDNVYASPEQRRGLTGDRRSDLFSAALLIYRLVSGKLPFDPDSGALAPRSLRNFSQSVPEQLDEMLLRCLVSDPERRSASTGPLVQALRRMRNEVQNMLVRDRGLSRTDARRAVSGGSGRRNLDPAVRSLLRDYLDVD